MVEGPSGRTVRAGFTLVEVLVTLVLIALLIGVVLPAVIRQVDRGEPTRVAQDLESIRTAVQMFRIDVRRFPGTPEQLVYAPVDWEEVFDHSGTEIPEGLRARWDGPYLEIGGLTAALAEPDTLAIALGILADPLFGTDDIGTTTWLTLDFINVTQTVAEGISEIIDGNDVLTAGRVRWLANVMTYYIVPIN